MRIPEHWRTQERERTLKGVAERPVTPRPAGQYEFPLALEYFRMILSKPAKPPELPLSPDSHAAD